MQKSTQIRRGRPSKRPPLCLSEAIIKQLECISRSRTEPIRKVERAEILLRYAKGEMITHLSKEFGSRKRVEVCIKKALAVGALSALDDLSGRGKPPTITPEARTWLLSLACQKPKDLGYPHELWTLDLLAKHIQKHCVDMNHQCLANLVKSTISKILSNANIKPHKINYYLEKRDSDFDQKMADVLMVYQEVELLKEKKETSRGEESIPAMTILSYDEKPGIQAIENTAPDLMPVVGEYATIARDHEYIRHGTLSLMAGIDLISGHIHSKVTARHRSQEFIEFINNLNNYYPKDIKIRLILDNHSAHKSKETIRFLATLPGRFEFIFTPKHGSWLNIVESFFSKMARTLLRGIRVKSIDELTERITNYLNDLNKNPIPFQWKYGLEGI